MFLLLHKLFSCMEEVDSQEIRTIPIEPSQEQAITFDVPYHSGPYERFPCKECKTRSVEVRLFHQPSISEACYLCRNCQQDCWRYQNYIPLTFQYTVKRPTQGLIQEWELQRARKQKEEQEKRKLEEVIPQQ